MLMKTLYFLRPSFSKILVLVILISMTILVIVHSEATSKVSWDQMRGIPFPFLMLTEYRGSCLPSNAFCVKVYFERIFPIELIKNILVWYVVSCVLILIYETVPRQHRVNKSDL